MVIIIMNNEKNACDMNVKMLSLIENVYSWNRLPCESFISATICSVPTTATTITIVPYMSYIVKSIVVVVVG